MLRSLGAFGSKSLPILSIKKTFLLVDGILKAVDMLTPEIVQEDSRQCCRWRTGGVVRII